MSSLNICFKTRKKRTASFGRTASFKTNNLYKTRKKTFSRFACVKKTQV